MMRSLYAGVSGLQNHQTRMDVLGNNIANVNTIGFKKGRVNFQDLLSQTVQGASRPSTDLGGVSSKQIGLGMVIASIDTLHLQGSLQTTGNMTDFAIQGEGFFVLRDGDKQFFTRSGAFGIDGDGMMVNPANGMRVQGWAAQSLGGQTLIDTGAALSDLRIPIGAKDPAAATTEVFMASNLDKRTPEILPGATAAELVSGTHATSLQVYDSFGQSHLLQVEFTKVSGVANQWLATVSVDPAANMPSNTVTDVGATNSVGNQFIVDFDNLGALQSLVDLQGDAVDTGELQVQVSFDVAGADAVPGQPPTRQTFNLNLGKVGSYSEAVTQFAETSSTRLTEQNGNGMGYLESFQVDQTGTVVGVFSNGVSRLLGQIGMAGFTNPGGLEKVGDTNFAQSVNSGAANIAPSGIAGKGRIVAGALEMSNVDLTQEFTDMIVTQRGFQASSRTITTADQMLQEILSLKR